VYLSPSAENGGHLFLKQLSRKVSPGISHRSKSDPDPLSLQRSPWGRDGAVMLRGEVLGNENMKPVSVTVSTMDFLAEQV